MQCIFIIITFCWGPGLDVITSRFSQTSPGSTASNWSSSDDNCGHGRYAVRASKGFPAAFQQHIKTFPLFESIGDNKYYRGGFDMKMSKREAGLILGISPSANKLKIKEAHRRIMLLNHPDRGGSPYIASKINEAKEYLESGKP